MSVEERNGYRIVDRRGQSRPSSPAALTSSLYATPHNSGEQDFYRPRPWVTQDPRQTINDYDWADILQYSRQLFAQVGTLAGAILQKNTYAIGDAWKPQYIGENKKWGAAAATWLNEVWYPNCDYCGQHDLISCLHLSALAWDVDGDDVCIFTEDESGFPKLMFKPAHCIGSRGDTVKGFGQFDGAMNRNGVLLDERERYMGIYLLGDTEDADEIIPALNCDLRFEPQWRPQWRGIPPLGRTLLDSFDAQDIDHYLKRGVKLDASQGILVSNEAGGVETTRNYIAGRESTAPATDIKVEKRYGGEIWYLRAGKNESVEPYKSDRPHPNTEAFINRIERRIMLSIGWFIELIDPSKVGGASVRMIQDEARHSVIARQKTLRKRVKRAVAYAIARAIKTGRLPENDVDQFAWDFQTPAEITVDAGYDHQADMEGLRIGYKTLAEVCQKKGRWWGDVRKQREEEAVDLLQRADVLIKAAAALGHELTLAQALDLLSQPSPNARIEQTSGKTDDES